MYICICILFVLILSFLHVTIFRCIPTVVNLLPLHILINGLFFVLCKNILLHYVSESVTVSEQYTMSLKVFSDGLSYSTSRNSKEARGYTSSVPSHSKLMGWTEHTINTVGHDIICRSH